MLKIRNIKIYSKPVRALSGEELNFCRKLNFGMEGGMLSALERCLRLPTSRSRAYLASMDGKIIGWCLVMKLKDGRTAIHTYVSTYHRGRGVGRALVAKAISRRKSPVVFYSSRASGEFYSHLKMDNLQREGLWFGRDSELLG